MPSKKPTKKTPGKKTKKSEDKELEDKELDGVAGGATTDPLDKVEMRKRPGRVKSLHPNT